MALAGEPVPHNFTHTEFRKHYVNMVEEKGEEMVTYHLESLDDELIRASQRAQQILTPTVASEQVSHVAVSLTHDHKHRTNPC